MNGISLESSSSLARTRPHESNRRLRFASLFLFVSAWFLWMWIPKGAPSGFFARPSFASVVNGESGPDDPKARCEPNCRFHHRWPDGRIRAIHSALVTAFHDHEWASLSWALSWVDSSLRWPAIPMLCPKRLREDRILELPCRIPSTWRRREAPLHPDYSLMIPNCAFFVMGESPVEDWREPVVLVVELGDFGTYSTGRGGGKRIERRESGAKLLCGDDVGVVHVGLAYIPTYWREDAWNLVSGGMVLSRPDGREFSIAAEGPAARMIEELPGLRSFIDSLLDAP